MSDFITGETDVAPFVMTRGHMLRDIRIYDGEDSKAIGAGFDGKAAPALSLMIIFMVTFMMAMMFSLKLMFLFSLTPVIMMVTTVTGLTSGTT